MSAERKIIYSSVGDNAKNSDNDVRSLQQLLKAAGHNCDIDGKWGKNTRKALYQFENSKAEEMQGPVVPQGPVVEKEENDAPLPYSPKIESNSDIPFEIAQKAGLIVNLPQKKGIAGVKELHSFFRKDKTPYNSGAEKGKGNRSLYGIVNKRGYAIQRNSGTFGGRLEMDCTTYVNLMLSIYLQGHIHTKPYDAACGDFGGISTSHCARDRYGFTLIKREEGKKKYGAFSTLEQIESATKDHEEKLHVLEVGKGKSGGVTHMALLYNETVYECTTGQSNGACIDHSLKDFMKSKKGAIIYLFRET